jgi:hypothetical protein
MGWGVWLGGDVIVGNFPITQTQKKSSITDFPFNLEYQYRMYAQIWLQNMAINTMDATSLITMHVMSMF